MNQQEFEDQQSKHFILSIDKDEFDATIDCFIHENGTLWFDEDSIKLYSKDRDIVLLDTSETGIEILESYIEFLTPGKYEILKKYELEK